MGVAGLPMGRMRCWLVVVVISTQTAEVIGLPSALAEHVALNAGCRPITGGDSVRGMLHEF